MAEAGDGSGHTPLTPEWTPAPRASHYPWQGDRPAAAPSYVIWLGDSAFQTKLHRWFRLYALSAPRQLHKGRSPL